MLLFGVQTEQRRIHSFIHSSIHCAVVTWDVPWPAASTQRATVGQRRRLPLLLLFTSGRDRVVVVVVPGQTHRGGFLAMRIRAAGMAIKVGCKPHQE